MLKNNSVIAWEHINLDGPYDVYSGLRDYLFIVLQPL